MDNFSIRFKMPPIFTIQTFEISNMVRKFSTVKSHKNLSERKVVVSPNQED